MEGVFAESTCPGGHLDDAFSKTEPSITIGLLPRRKRSTTVGLLPQYRWATAPAWLSRWQIRAGCPTVR